jgi:hypothetical protein
MIRSIHLAVELSLLLLRENCSLKRISNEDGDDEDAETEFGCCQDGAQVHHFSLQ